MFKEELENWFDRNALRLSIWLAVILSVGSFSFFYLNGQWNLVYYDALAHLNMGRKIFDNLTPGFAQLGGLWLPLTHILLIPFVWNDFMWQSGLAGYLVSGLAFILSVYLIFKIVDLLFQDKKSAFLAALVYMTNVNMLYLQSVAMMESLFNLTIIGSIYYIAKWIKKDSISDLIVGGIFVAASTLTRYEGYGVFIVATCSIVLISFLKNKEVFKKKSIEGNLLLFVSIAGLGIAIWTAYLWAIFGDPLHWLHPYDNIATNTQSVEAEIQKVTTKPDVPIPMVQDGDGKFHPEYYHDILKSISYLFGATANSVGVVMIIVASIGTLGLLFSHFRREIDKGVLAVMGISTSVFLFLLVTMYLGKVSVWGPSLLGGGIFDKSLNNFNEAGIRYTIALLPFVAIFSSVISLGRWYRKLLFSILLVFQVSAVFFGPLFLTYNLPLKWKVVYGHDIGASEWLKANYSGGLILVSAIAHETEMFKNGIEYKNYIHEGTEKFWNESLESPTKHATWIIMNKSTITSTQGIWGSDTVTVRLTGSEVLSGSFDLLYDDNQIQIYKRKVE